MIFIIIGLSLHGFVFGFLTQKVSYQLDIIHAYKLINLLNPNRCETLGSRPIILSSNKVLSSFLSNQDFPSHPVFFAIMYDGEKVLLDPIDPTKPIVTKEKRIFREWFA